MKKWSSITSLQSRYNTLFHRKVEKSLDYSQTIIQYAGEKRAEEHCHRTLEQKNNLKKSIRASNWSGLDSR